MDTSPPTMPHPTMLCVHSMNRYQGMSLNAQITVNVSRGSELLTMDDAAIQALAVWCGRDGGTKWVDAFELMLIRVGRIAAKPRYRPKLRWEALELIHMDDGGDRNTYIVWEGYADCAACDGDGRVEAPDDEEDESGDDYRCAECGGSGTSCVVGEWVTDFNGTKVRNPELMA